MNNLIITGGNIKYFDYLCAFVKSIRKNDLDDTKIIVCDNTINGSWDKPRSIKKGGSFTKKQMDFFYENNVKVIVFSDLLEKSHFPYSIFNEIITEHWAYPAKYIYCYLIASKYTENIGKVAFFDADVYFQDNPKYIFDKISKDVLYINHENSNIEDSKYVKEWISFSKKNIKSIDFDIIDVEKSKNFCTGFFAAKKDIFLRITNLAVLLSTNKILPFHSDQTLMNILIHTYGIAYSEIGDNVCHLARVNEKDIIYQNDYFLVNNSKPSAIHYHGQIRDFIKPYIFEDYNREKEEPSLLNKIRFKIKRKLF